MNNKNVQQGILATALLLCAGFLLFRFATFTEEQRMVLSDASMTGKITYKGKPVPYALVIVVSESSSMTGPADAHGNYTVEHAPVGDVQIGVNTAAGRGMMMSAVMAAKYEKDPAAKPSFVDIPVKYFDPKTSGITTKIANPKAANEFNIEIK